MKYVSFLHNDEEKIGRLVEDSISVISNHRYMIDLLDAGLDSAEYSQNEPIPLAEVTLLPPVTRPGKVIALGRNYAAHAAEGGAAPPAFPMLFHKTHTSLSAHEQAITIPFGTEQVDYEAELAVIIGKRCKQVSEQDALDYVAGYCVANDVTARDWQRRTSQFTAGKMVDGFGPLGPYLVSKDEVADVQNLAIKLWHNGNLMQSSNTKMMIFSVVFTIAYISKIATLEVGDVILTGTPEGVGFARTPPVFMQPGDVVTVEIDGLGQLTNRFSAAA